MALDLGWRAREVRESFWPFDPAFYDGKENRIALADIEAWGADGDASHLRKYIPAGAPKDRQPTRITFRALTPDETRLVRAAAEKMKDDRRSAGARLHLLCFRVAVDFPDLPAEVPDRAGKMHPRVVSEYGLRLMSENVVDHIDSAYEGLIDFYGALVFVASFASDEEKKASSPSSMQTPSSAAGSIAASTESPERAAPAAPG